MPPPPRAAGADPGVQHVNDLLEQARAREASLDEALEIVRRVAQAAAEDDAPRPKGGLGKLLGAVSPRRRAGHVTLAARLERLAMTSTRLTLALERVELEGRELAAWASTLEEACTRLGVEAEVARNHATDLELDRRDLERELDDPATSPERVAEAKQKSRELRGKSSVETGRAESALEGAKRLRRSAVAAGELRVAFSKVRAQLERLQARVAEERTALSGNVAIRAQVSRRKELAEDVGAALGGEDAERLAAETLRYLTDTLDLLRRHRQDREASGGGQ